MIESNQGPETCNTYNMIRLSTALFLTDPDVKYMDYYERSIYNHILSSQHPSKGGFVYFTPMRPRHYRVYSQPDNNFWCCVGSGIENHGKYGELIYAHNEKDLFVNLFIPSKLDWKEKGLSLEQNTKFPFEETTEISLNLKKSQRFAINFRYPGWVKSGELTISINGKNQILASSANSSYVSIDRKWKNGDVVKITLPMHTEVENLPDNSPWVSFVHGPIVLAAATETTDMPGLFADDSRMGHVADGKYYPIEEAPILVSSENDITSMVKPVPGKPLTFTISDLVYPEAYKNVQLTPFFDLHESRYMLYWPVTTPEGLEVKQKEMMEKEKEMLALEAITIDQVAPGEQQPESEHNFKGERTENGVHKDRFWRTSRAWFSYDLKNNNKEAKRLRITYYGEDRGRNFDILLNDVKVATVNLDGSKGDTFYYEDYNIPEEALQKDEETLTVKFVAHEQSIAGGIYGVRLLKE